jgi:actin-related protein
MQLTGTQCDPKETNLLLMEKPNCPKELQKNCDEIVFEQFEFAAYHRCIGPRLNAYHTTDPASLSALPQECLLIIDTSYSDTTILPLYNGRLLQSAVRRLTVGGKLLTNYLKELASLRHYNMMEETSAQRDQGGDIIRCAIVTALLEGSRTNVERSAGQQAGAGLQRRGRLCAAGL